jgi:hypothetical protein
MTAADGWDELLRELDDDQRDTDEDEWGVRRTLDVGTTQTGWWRGQDMWEGDYGPTPVYLMTDETGVGFFFFGGRKQLDKKITEAAPNYGDRVAIRRLEDAPAEEGRSGAWRVRVAVRRGDGTIPVASPAARDDVTEDAAEDGDGDIPF